MAGVFVKLRNANANDKTRLELEMWQLMDILVQISRLNEYSKKDAIELYMELYSRKFAKEGEKKEKNKNFWKFFTEVSKQIMFYGYVVNQEESRIFYLLTKYSSLKRLSFSRIEKIDSIENMIYEYYLDNNQLFKQLVLNVVKEIRANIVAK